MTAPTDLATFDYNGQPLRAIVGRAENWFLAGDVCAVLEIQNVGSALDRLDDDEQSSIRLADGTPGNPNRAIISEAGLYSLTLRSDKPEAKRFRRWVTHDVLPALRKTGTYTVPGRELSRLELIDLARDSELGRIAAEAEAAELRPAAAAWTALADAAGDYSLREAAEILCRANIKTGQNILARQLKQIGWTDRRGRPYQTQINNGRLAVRTRTFDDPYSGEPHITTQIRITGKGVDALYRAFTGTSLALVGAP